MVLVGRTFFGENSEFPKTFFAGYLFVFVEYLYNRSPKIETKNIKNYSSILAIVNYRNWLDDSPPLRKKYVCDNENNVIQYYQRWPWHIHIKLQQIFSYISIQLAKRILKTTTCPENTRA